MRSLRICHTLGVTLLFGLVCVADEKPGEPILHIGGTGGAYFLAEPGELVIELEKRDLNRSGRRADLRAILVGPDRQVLQDVTIPDDSRARGSGPGPVQTARLSTQVQRKGIYGLNITVSYDRYGTEVTWGFRTNCARYLIETSRGHRDARREEPIVLVGPDRARDVCFLPRRGKFGIEVSRLPKGAEMPSVYDDGGEFVETLTGTADGLATATVSADSNRPAAPWRLHLPRGQADVQIDSVTRWDGSDAYPNLPLWTPDRESWFPLHEYRWLLTPYRRTAYGEVGSEHAIGFRVHNNADDQRVIRLDLEFSDQPWEAQLATKKVTLDGKKSQQVTVHYTVPDDQKVVHIRTTPIETPEFSTYATLTVVPGPAPAGKPLHLPLTLKAYEHENEQFGYLPDHPVDNQVYFDYDNRPYVNTGSDVVTWRDSAWVESSLSDAVKSGEAELVGQTFGTASTKIGFDSENGVYLIGRTGRKVALLHSADSGKTFSAYSIPGREGSSRSFDIEQFSGHNGSDGPPPIVRFTRTASDPKRIWRRINDLELFVPERSGDKIVIGEPILLTKSCIGLSTHSGAPSSIVSRDSKVHVTWAEATDPQEKVPGVPTYVVTYDRQTKTLGKPALIGYGAPPNDIHNTPSMTMDSGGHLHVLAGTHGRPFQYARSLKPNDAGGGWTKTVPTGGEWKQTYIGLVCDADDTLHLVSRVWRYGEEPHPASYFATLAHQQKKAEGRWEPPKSLVVPPFSEYSVFYHRLTVDRLGRLFLSYDCWSTYWFYRTDHPGDRRALMMSPDGGSHWKLVETRDLVR
ncbi:MAG TPA: BNR-4 repeat-containing protein [Pirellulaceae bacterium]|nr:BNR-4 repeat-containing protein [Pirellulaceae bacterium]